MIIFEEPDERLKILIVEKKIDHSIIFEDYIRFESIEKANKFQFIKMTLKN